MIIMINLAATEKPKYALSKYININIFPFIEFKYLLTGPPRAIILDGARDIFGPFTHNSNILNYYCMLLLNQLWFNSTLVFEIGNCSQ